jgi:hypothetical protein
MSLSAVRPFFRSRMNSLGFKEHSDAFDDENREQSRLEKLYRIESGPVTSGPANQTTHEFEFSVTLIITLRGNRSNVDLVDRAFEVSEDVLEDILQESVRIDTDIKDVVPGVITIEPYSDSDDNDLILSMGFTGIVICQF